MHGIIHRSLKQYVIDRTSEEGWETIIDVAGVENRLYLPVSEYPDEEVTEVLATVTELTGHDEAAIQRDFGRYFAPQLLDTFDAHVGRDWNAIDAVEGLERIYPQVVAKDDAADSMQISTRRSSADTVVVHYRSSRTLCPMLEGMIEGIAGEYGDEIRIGKGSPTRDGLRHCELTVRNVQ
jgi:hypothetical protein